VARLRQLNRSVPNPTYETFKKAIEHESPEICANTMISLIKNHHLAAESADKIA